MQTNSLYFAQLTDTPELTATSAAHTLINHIFGEVDTVRKAFVWEKATFVHVTTTDRNEYTVKVYDDIVYAEVFSGLLEDVDFTAEAVGITGTYVGKWMLKGFNKVEIRKADD